MNRSIMRTKIWPLIVLTIGGFLQILLCFALYYGLFMGVERYIFHSRPQEMNGGALRIFFSTVLCLGYVLILRSKLSHLLKALFMIGPFTVLLITVGIAFYQSIAISVLIFALIIAVVFFLLWKNRLPWIYYYALFFSLACGLLFAWPRVE